MMLRRPALCANQPCACIVHDRDFGGSHPQAGRMAARSEKVFRQVALDRLASPEQLDQLIVLTSPIGWAALTAIAALLSAIVVWGIFGAVPTRIEGAGILVARGGQVFDAMAPTSGTL